MEDYDFYNVRLARISESLHSIIGRNCQLNTGAGNLDRAVIELDLFN